MAMETRAIQGDRWEVRTYIDGEVLEELEEHELRGLLHRERRVAHAGGARLLEVARRAAARGRHVLCCERAHRLLVRPLERGRPVHAELHE